MPQPNVTFTSQARQEISDFILRVEGARPTGVRVANLYRSVASSVASFETLYKDSEWFANNSVHSFEALTAGLPGERYPKEILMLHFLRMRVPQLRYVIGSTNELALPTNYETDRVIEEAKMAASLLPD